ncbi:unnamed protein product [Ostreobium quekettii]|uniref:Uncharacterized protein n=1 Tax=Ostreobium quekettii TaxID=121088 RepID=A0A8S1ISE3_9CHLO|nr:unnamed protein product [Ostreobium quekettii]|eukprot:evm.model.scf_494EXC.4 EVM.evm.TU.scf_494EXC.4   scf_494EXC:39159-42255(+)
MAPHGEMTALVTGGNTGIGFETAKAMCAQGYRTLIACRNMDKAAAAKQRIKDAVPSAKVEAAYVDLADLKTVRDFASRVLDSGAPLDVVVNNAGVMACAQMSTVDGFEYQFGVNHLSHFLLTNLLLPLMRDQDRPARIVNVSSEAHKFGTINFDDLQFEKRYQRWAAYGQSKLANILFTYELSRRLNAKDKIATNCLHPGMVKTELQRHIVPDPNAWYMKPLNTLTANFIKSPEEGAQTSIYLATSPKVEGVTGKYFISCKPADSTKKSKEKEVARRLWAVSCELTGC